MNKSTRGISHCKGIPLFHLCQGGAAVPHPFSLATRDRNLRTCLIEGCQWEESLREEYIFCAFYFVFLFPSGLGSSVSYRNDTQVCKESLCSTHIKPHWNSYILSFWKKSLELLCRKCCKSSFKVNESSHSTVRIAKSNPGHLFPGSLLLTVCQL